MVMAPTLLLLGFVYLHFSLMDIWIAWASLPAIFPDGRRIYERSSPWIINSLSEMNVERLRTTAPWQVRLQGSFGKASALVPGTCLGYHVLGALLNSAKRPFDVHPIGSPLHDSAGCAAILDNHGGHIAHAVYATGFSVARWLDSIEKNATTLMCLP
jgi:hypothetical protein